MAAEDYNRDLDFVEDHSRDRDLVEDNNNWDWDFVEDGNIRCLAGSNSPFHVRKDRCP